MKRRPIRKWIVRSLLVTFLLFLLFLGKLYWDWRSTRRAGEEHLARVMKELDESEPGWRDVFETRNQRLAPPERNSAEKALVVLQSLPTEILIWCEQAKPTDGVEPNQLLPDERIAELKEKLAPHEAAIEKLKELIRSEPNSGFAFSLLEPNPLDTPLENRSQFRRASQLLSFQLAVNLAEKQDHQTTQNCRAMMGAGRALGDDPNLISQLIRLKQSVIAIQSLERLLGNGEPTNGLIELQSEMLEESNVPFFRNSMRGERVFLDRLMENVDNYSAYLPLAGGKQPGPFEKFKWTVAMQFAPEQRAYSLRLATDVLNETNKEWPDRPYHIAALLVSIRDLDDRHFAVLKMMMPGYHNINQTEQHIITQLRCAVVALACERYRIAYGRWPNSIAEIPKSILAEVPNDPFTGEPLMMTRTEIGLNIYSTGQDHLDNGGETLSHSMEPGTDIGFRLYDPVHRRKPAPVKVQVDDEGLPKP